MPAVGRARGRGGSGGGPGDASNAADVILYTVLCVLTEHKKSEQLHLNCQIKTTCPVISLRCSMTDPIQAKLYTDTLPLLGSIISGHNPYQIDNAQW